MWMHVQGDPRRFRSKHYSWDLRASDPEMFLTTLLLAVFGGSICYSCWILLLHRNTPSPCMNPACLNSVKKYFQNTFPITLSFHEALCCPSSFRSGGKQTISPLQIALWLVRKCYEVWPYFYRFADKPQIDSPGQVPPSPPFHGAVSGVACSQVLYPQSTSLS